MVSTKKCQYCKSNKLISKKGGNTEEDDCTGILWSQMYSTCWFNAILMSILFSKKIHKYLPRDLYTTKHNEISESITQFNMYKGNLLNGIYQISNTNSRSFREYKDMSITNPLILNIITENNIINKNQFLKIETSLKQRHDFYEMLKELTKSNTTSQGRIELLKYCLEPSYILNIIRNLGIYHTRLDKTVVLGKKGYNKEIYIYQFLHAIGVLPENMIYFAAHYNGDQSKILELWELGCGGPDSKGNHRVWHQPKHLKGNEQRPIQDIRNVNILLLSIGYFHMFDNRIGEPFAKLQLNEVINHAEFKVPEVITILDRRFKLISFALTSFKKVDKTTKEAILGGHAIAGVSCANKKYLYNGWLMENDLPCDLTEFDWVNDSNSFILDQDKCGITYTTEYDIDNNVQMQNANNNNNANNSGNTVMTQANGKNNNVKMQNATKTQDDTQYSIVPFNCLKSKRLYIYVAE
jgi:hypothetical protein